MTRTLLTALAATLLAGCAPAQLVPSSAAEGFITDITAMDAGFVGAQALALGPGGEVLMRTPGDSPDLLLIYRDGTSDRVFSPKDAATEGGGDYPVAGFVSATTVAWVVYPGEAGSAFAYFWDRESHAVTSAPTTITTGADAGDRLSEPGRFSTLLGDTLVWSEKNAGGDAVDHGVVGVSPDGSGRVLLDEPGIWMDLGTDTCLSTPNSPVLWATSTVFHDATASDPGGYVSISRHFTLEDGRLVDYGDKPVTRSVATDGFYLFFGGARCGDDLLSMWKDGADTFYAQLVGGSDGPVIAVNPGQAGANVPTASALTREWSVTSLTGTSADVTSTVVFRRADGRSAPLATSPQCGPVAVAGDYIMWGSDEGSANDFAGDPSGQDVLVCRIYVGKLANA